MLSIAAPAAAAAAPTWRRGGGGATTTTATAVLKDILVTKIVKCILLLYLCQRLWPKGSSAVPTTSSSRPLPRWTKINPTLMLLLEVAFKREGFFFSSLVLHGRKHNGLGHVSLGPISRLKVVVGAEQHGDSLKLHTIGLRLKCWCVRGCTSVQVPDRSFRRFFCLYHSR